MIESNFNEEFFRIENNLLTNEQKITADREGRIIFTIPFFEQASILTDTKFFAGQNILPENTNIIIDNVALWSTNPNLENYLPMKIGLGTNFKIELGSAFFVTLTDYKIIVDPPINFPVIENRRYANPEEAWLEINNNVILVQNVVQSVEDIYFRVNTNVTQEIWHFDLGDDTFDELIFVDQPNEIYANEDQSVANVNNAGDIELYNLEVGPILIDTLGAETLLDLFLINNVMIVVTQDNGAPFDRNIYHYVKNELTNDYRQIHAFPGIAATEFDRTGFYRVNRLIGVETNPPGTVKNLFLNFDGTLATISTEIVFDFDEFVGTIPTGVFASGSNLDRPNVSVMFDIGGGVLTWFFFQELSLPAIRTNIPIRSQIVLKKYRNQVYFVDFGAGLNPDAIIYFLNLDTNTVTRYRHPRDSTTLQDGRIGEKVNLVPRLSTAVNFSDFDFIDSGHSINLVGLSQIAWTRSNNQRILNEVFKATFSYDNRQYPLNFGSERFELNISLPNNTPVSDAEIFKYSIDCRVRYCKVPKDVYQITRDPDFLDTDT